MMSNQEIEELYNKVHMRKPSVSNPVTVNPSMENTFVGNGLLVHEKFPETAIKAKNNSNVENAAGNSMISTAKLQNTNEIYSYEQESIVRYQ